MSRTHVSYPCLVSTSRTHVLSPLLVPVSCLHSTQIPSLCKMKLQRPMLYMEGIIEHVYIILIPVWGGLLAPFKSGICTNLVGVPHILRGDPITWSVSRP